MLYIKLFMVFAIVHLFALLVHELGHFLAARRFGVRVLGISLGFGREIIGFSDSFGTRWSLAAIPLGSFIRMADNKNWIPSLLEMEQRPIGKQPESLSSCSRGQRAAIYAAGSAANILITPVTYIFAQLYFTGTLAGPNAFDADSMMGTMLGLYSLVVGLSDLLPLPLHSGGKLALLFVEWLRDTRGSLLRELENLVDVGSR
jgi:membrane-associated protease RseP (regulator of RpoE activity)